MFKSPLATSVTERQPSGTALFCLDFAADCAAMSSAESTPMPPNQTLDQMLAQDAKLAQQLLPLPQGRGSLQVPQMREEPPEVTPTPPTEPARQVLCPFATRRAAAATEQQVRRMQARESCDVSEDCSGDWDLVGSEQEDAVAPHASHVALSPQTGAGGHTSRISQGVRAGNSAAHLSSIGGSLSQPDEDSVLDRVPRFNTGEPQYTYGDGGGPPPPDNELYLAVVASSKQPLERVRRDGCRGAHACGAGRQQSSSVDSCDALQVSSSSLGSKRSEPLRAPPTAPPAQPVEQDTSASSSPSPTPRVLLPSPMQARPPRPAGMPARLGSAVGVQGREGKSGDLVRTQAPAGVAGAAPRLRSAANLVMQRQMNASALRHSWDVGHSGVDAQPAEAFGTHMRSVLSQRSRTLTHGSSGGGGGSSSLAPAASESRLSHASSDAGTLRHTQPEPSLHEWPQGHRRDWTADSLRPPTRMASMGDALVHVKAVSLAQRCASAALSFRRCHCAHHRCHCAHHRCPCLIFCAAHRFTPCIATHRCCTSSSRWPPIAAHPPLAICASQRGAACPAVPTRLLWAAGDSIPHKCRYSMSSPSAMRMRPQEGSFVSSHAGLADLQAASTGKPGANWVPAYPGMKVERWQEVRPPEHVAP
jgi:hypothetical protein